MKNSCKKSGIPIVLATDKQGIGLLYVTILSAILNKKKSTSYDFYCLVQNKVSKYVHKQFDKISKKYEGISITFINMKNDFQDKQMQIKYISSPTYYRLKLANIFPQYDKIIYLDIDTIVMQDLTSLYDIDLEDNYIAGVHTVGYKIEIPDYNDKLNIPDLDSYINAGIIVWNLDLIRKDNMTEKLLTLSNNVYKYMDQDIINIAFYNRIKHIDFKYNLMVSYKHRFLDDKEKCKIIYETYGENSIKQAIQNPAIIHYASEKKPWVSKKVWLGEYWRKVAKKSPFKKFPQTTQKDTTEFLEQLEKTRYNRTVFWGASLFLKDVLETNKLKYTNIVGIIDKDKTKQGQYIERYKIFSPEEIEELNPSVIIFSIKHHSSIVYEDVKKFLQRYPNIKLLPNIF